MSRSENPGDSLRIPFPRISEARQKLASVLAALTTFSANLPRRIIRGREFSATMINGRLAYRATRGHSYPPGETLYPPYPQIKFLIGRIGQREVHRPFRISIRGKFSRVRSCANRMHISRRRQNTSLIPVGGKDFFFPLSPYARCHTPRVP